MNELSITIQWPYTTWMSRVPSIMTRAMGVEGGRVIIDKPYHLVYIS